MVSIQSIACFVRASSSSSSLLRAAAAAKTTQRSLARQCSTTTTPTTRIPSGIILRSSSATCTNLRPLVAIRPSRAWYSQDATAQNKIYDFEGIKKLTTAPKPNTVLVDSREPGELQRTGRIPGAINIPVTTAPDSFHITPEEFEDRFGYPQPAKDAEVVFYCKAGVRSRAAAGLARDAGWTKVSEYPGSWLDWVENGGKVQR
ncbi:Rhodanese-like domain-containing protein [Podospora didyma]|uniref:Rhodanese-like domain-containing protein n=1 Tax=Podospora didyma TaxID=330526 RepID=A0AAE0NZB9_9PEZI|nr:Rhodanese-like domain-containing protein [Podospora didyma]